MASTYGNDLRLEEIGDGEQSGTWGATTNTNLELIAEALSFGTEAITTNANTHTTTIADGATDPGRSLYLKYTGTLDSACTITIAPNSISKTWYIENGTSGSQSIIISQGSGANVTILTGQTKIVYSDGAGSGAAMAEIGTLGVTNLAVTTNATVGGTLGVTGVLTGTSLDISGNVDIDGTTNLDAVDIDGAVQLDATLTVGANDQGYDVILYGDTAARNAAWDSSADSLIFTDNTKAVFGTGSDASILFDGTDMKVGATAGHLDLFTSEVGSSVRILGSGESLAEFTDDGDVDLFHNGTLKMSTTATGISVAGSVVDNLTRGSIKVGNSSGVFAPLAIGGANTLLQSNGTDAAWATVSGSDSRQSYVTNATVAARAGVFLNNDGTVDQTASYPLADNDVVVSTFNAELGGDYGVQYNGHAGSSAYKDSGTVADRRHVTIYKYRAGTSAANARYVVSAVAADGAMTHGTPAAFNSSGPMNNCNVKYNANIDRFIAVYDYGGWDAQGSYGGIAVAVGTLNASNNTVAWTHTTNLGNAGGSGDSERGFTYYDGLSSIESPSFDIADDGSHLMMSHIGKYNNEANENNSDRLSVKVATINAGNNSVSGGGWKDALVSSGTKYDRPGGVTPSSLHWHQNSSQYILCASSDAAGNRYTKGDQQIFLFTVSGNTPTQVNYALGPLLVGGMTAGYAAPQISWYDVTSTKCWGIGMITWNGGTTYIQRLAFYEMTVGSGSISNIKGRSVPLFDTITGEALLYSSIPNDKAVATAAVVYNSSGTAFVAYKQKSTTEVQPNVSIIEMAYDETTVGTVVNLKIDQVSADQNIPIPKGGDFVTYDTGRDFLFTCGTDKMLYGSAQDYQIVAQTINVANNGSGLNPIGIHDSSSSASSGATITVAGAGSVVSGFSGLTIGASQLAGGKKIGYATSATKVFVTADGKGE